MKKLSAVGHLFSLITCISTRTSTSSKTSIYNSSEGKRLILDYYDRTVLSLKYDFTGDYVDTEFGKTHVLTSRSKNTIPLVIVHGSSTLNPVELKPYEYLSQYYQIIAPDTIGKPGYSAENRLSADTDDYGKWIVGILDHYNIRCANFIATSVGGGILMKLAAFAPERINKAVLVVPMGITEPGFRTFCNVMIRLAFPALWYLYSPNDERLMRAFEPLYEDKSEITGEVIEYNRLIYLHTPVIRASIKSPDSRELDRYTAPTMLISCENDIFFPPRELIPAAKKKIKNLTNVLILENGTHCMSENKMKSALKAMVEFLDH